MTFVSGQLKTADLKAGTQLRILGLKEVDILIIVQSITKLAITLANPQQVGIVFDQLEEAALTGRHGPVWLDVQAMKIDPDQLARLPKGECVLTPSTQLFGKLKAVIDLLIQITDCYLLALAVVQGGRLVSFDQRITVDLVKEALDQLLSLIEMPSLGG